MLLELAVPKSSLKQIGMKRHAQNNMLENDNLEYTANHKKKPKHVGLCTSVQGTIIAAIFHRFFPDG